jgi:hypothetical protein
MIHQRGRSYRKLRRAEAMRIDRRLAKLLELLKR